MAVNEDNALSKMAGRFSIQAFKGACIPCGIDSDGVGENKPEHKKATS